MICIFFLFTKPMLLHGNDLFVGLPIVSVKGSMLAIALR